MEDVTYSLVYINYHDGTSIRTGHYLCDIFDFNTGILWCCDDDNITQLKGIPDNVYSVAPYPTSGNTKK